VVVEDCNPVEVVPVVVETAAVVPDEVVAVPGIV
jgi:hypothetical protein